REGAAREPAEGGRRPDAAQRSAAARGPAAAPGTARPARFGVGGRGGRGHLLQSRPVVRDRRGGGTRARESRRGGTRERGGLSGGDQGGGGFDRGAAGGAGRCQRPCA